MIEPVYRLLSVPPGEYFRIRTEALNNNCTDPCKCTVLFFTTGAGDGLGRDRNQVSGNGTFVERFSVTVAISEPESGDKVPS